MDMAARVPPPMPQMNLLGMQMPHPFPFMMVPPGMQLMPRPATLENLIHPQPQQLPQIPPTSSTMIPLQPSPPSVPPGFVLASLLPPRVVSPASLPLG
jgi:hypothetical protein